MPRLWKVAWIHMQPCCVIASYAGVTEQSGCWSGLGPRVRGATFCFGFRDSLRQCMPTHCLILCDLIPVWGSVLPTHCLILCDLIPVWGSAPTQPCTVVHIICTAIDVGIKNYYLIIFILVPIVLKFYKCIIDLWLKIRSNTKWEVVDYISND